MKPVYDLVIVIPIGPKADPFFVADTIESVQHYTACRYKIIIADDSQKGTGALLQKSFPELHVMVTEKNLGKVAGLYVNLSKAFRYALEQYDFKALLKLDDDALVIGPEPEQEALRLFEAHPEVGMAGRWIRGRFSPDAFGNLHDNYWPRKQILKDACSWKMVRRPTANWTLRQFFFKAVRNGYELGENIQGGAYFISRSCAERLQAAGCLPHARLGLVNLGEDHLFSLLTRVVGLELGDLAGDEGPIGLAWQGLPAAPEVLHGQGRKITHSVRYWKDLREDAIRAYFRAVRAGGRLESEKNLETSTVAPVSA